MGGIHVSVKPHGCSLTTAFTVTVKVWKWESQKNRASSRYMSTLREVQKKNPHPVKPQALSVTHDLMEASLCYRSNIQSSTFPSPSHTHTHTHTNRRRVSVAVETEHKQKTSMVAIKKRLNTSTSQTLSVCHVFTSVCIIQILLLILKTDTNESMISIQ